MEGEVRGQFGVGMGRIEIMEVQGERTYVAIVLFCSLLSSDVFAGLRETPVIP